MDDKSTTGYLITIQCYYMKDDFYSVYSALPLLQYKSIFRESHVWYIGMIDGIHFVML